MILERIKNLCSARGTSISELERNLSFGHATVRNWEKSSPSVEKLKKVADYFEVSVDYLLTDKTLSEKAITVATKFDCLNDNQKKAISQILDSYSCENRKE
ncbi:MAG: hypothetical protein BI182_08235 [Acetobacterium sp. MES1]|uniref:helix-turn-helix domain-containing protein n=1 Tax=Acetobacterium sp. MES1 TaxID=1899015 RepID=UPI000B9C9718|nr:helix-turn-helix transcriptional regulator [Acetobacterium sp. MES1]OXS26376.1 MAG: hypothetical protein BI182_08235 [Acetobacterium sp. MES1]